MAGKPPDPAQNFRDYSRAMDIDHQNADCNGDIKLKSQLLIEASEDGAKKSTVKTYTKKRAGQDTKKVAAK